MSLEGVIDASGSTDGSRGRMPTVSDKSKNKGKKGINSGCVGLATSSEDQVSHFHTNVLCSQCPECIEFNLDSAHPFPLNDND